MHRGVVGSTYSSGVMISEVDSTASINFAPIRLMTSTLYHPVITPKPVSTPQTSNYLPHISFLFIFTIVASWCILQAIPSRSLTADLVTLDTNNINNMILEVEKLFNRLNILNHNVQNGKRSIKENNSD